MKHHVLVARLAQNGNLSAPSCPGRLLRADNADITNVGIVANGHVFEAGIEDARLSHRAAIGLNIGIETAQINASEELDIANAAFCRVKRVGHLNVAPVVGNAAVMLKGGNFSLC